jgi:MoxR-like ATPase
MSPANPLTLELVREGLARARYLTTPRVETVLYLALCLEKPLLIEGPAGAGKTEIGKVLAETLRTDLVRLLCYEGLDEAKALYEWNYQKQLLRIQADRGEALDWNAVTQHIFTRDYLFERPLLHAITAPHKLVLLIDEVDKADEEFEAFLLEVLSDFQISIPELGTIKATHRPVVVLTSNRTRELSEALKRRCLYLYLDFPGLEIERDIIALKVSDLEARLRDQVARFVNNLRKLDLRKAPSIAETLDWARALRALGIKELDTAAVRQTLNLVLKHEEDLRKVESKLSTLVAATARQGS